MLVLRRAFALTGMTVATVMLAACARSAQRAPSGAGDSVESITIGGVARRYRLHVSAAYQAGHPAPLVINLHGYNSNAKQQEQVSRMSALNAGQRSSMPEGPA